MLIIANKGEKCARPQLPPLPMAMLAGSKGHGFPRVCWRSMLYSSMGTTPWARFSFQVGLGNAHFSTKLNWTSLTQKIQERNRSLNYSYWEKKELNGARRSLNIQKIVLFALSLEFERRERRSNLSEKERILLSALPLSCPPCTIFPPCSANLTFLDHL